MTYGQAILLGFVQGVAEFLPISSSGHLAVLQNFLAIGDMENHLLFDVLLHLGTLAAVFLALRGEISPLWNEGLRMLHLKKTRRGEEPDGVKRRMIWFLIAATLPLALAAVLNKYVESLYQNTFFIGFAFLMTGVLLFAADRMGHGNKNERGATLGDAVVVGLAQMIAVVPGLSRSGTTIPAVLGANLVSLVKAFAVGVDWSMAPKYLVGVLVAFVSGYFAIYLLRMIVQRGKFGGFAYYCWGAGLVTLILSLTV